MNNIQQVEIVRGPSSLLYTNGALGGIVNVVDNTIAREDFAEQEIKLGVEHNSVSDGDVHNISFSDNIEGVNLSYAYKHQNFNNFDIPDEAVIHEPGHTEEEKDHIENSDAKTRAYKGGFSIVEDWGHFGLSFKNIENVYGIPFHGEHEDPQPGQPHHDEEERIESSTDSDTINLKGTYKIAGDFINEIEYFYSDTDYFLRELHIGGKHDGEFTDFLNDAQELGAILDLSNDALTQKVVLRTMEEDTSILGEEAFMESVDPDVPYVIGAKPVLQHQVTHAVDRRVRPAADRIGLYILRLNYPAAAEIGPEGCRLFSLDGNRRRAGETTFGKYGLSLIHI